MNTLRLFTTTELRAALARPWSTAATEEIRAELRARGIL
jgi:hypothetical protein